MLTKVRKIFLYLKKIHINNNNETTYNKNERNADHCLSKDMPKKHNDIWIILI